MKSYLKYGITLGAIFAFLFFAGSEIAWAQQSHTYAGSVAGADIGAFSRGTITVKGSDGAFMIFAVGHNTIYNPPRQPLIGEWVKITYSFTRGENVAYQVEIRAAAPPPPPPKPQPQPEPQPLPQAPPQSPTQPQAEEHLMVTGKVVGMHNNQLTLKDGKGRTLYFSTEKSTVFIPAREPKVDEKVKVTYYVRQGDNVATQVENLSAKK
jgi:hypothetical protein